MEEGLGEEQGHISVSLPAPPNFENELSLGSIPQQVVFTTIYRILRHSIELLQWTYVEFFNKHPV